MSVKDNDHSIVLVWKIKELDYFQSNLVNKNDAHIITTKNQTHYQDIYIFMNHVQDVIADRNEEMIRNNLHICLHKIVLS